MDKILDGFRPLARKIGSYTQNKDNAENLDGVPFPTPREIDR